MQGVRPSKQGKEGRNMVRVRREAVQSDGVKGDPTWQQLRWNKVASQHTLQGIIGVSVQY
jgi:hypothetical protein